MPRDASVQFACVLPPVTMADDAPLLTGSRWLVIGCIVATAKVASNLPPDRTMLLELPRSGMTHVCSQVR